MANRTPTIIHVPTAVHTYSALPLSGDMSRSFAEGWYRDTLREATGADGHDSKRREIIAAACFLESYIFEWALSVCRTAGDARRITVFCPTDSKRNFVGKWREVPRTLAAAGLILSAPKVDLSHAGMLRDYRNGLVHAGASRPEFFGDPSDGAQPKPSPSLNDWGRKINHGWALGIARRMVLALHHGLGTKPPPWFDAAPSP